MVHGQVYRRSQLTPSSISKKSHGSRTLETIANEADDPISQDCQQIASHPIENDVPVVDPVIAPRRSFKGPNQVEQLSIEEVVSVQQHGMEFSSPHTFVHSMGVQLSMVPWSLTKRSYLRMVLIMAWRSHISSGYKSGVNCLKRT